MGQTVTVQYSLEQLYVDQQRDLVIDTISPVLAWMSGKGRIVGAPTFAFEVQHSTGGAARTVDLKLTWDLAALARQDAETIPRATRMIAGRTAQREHVTELAGYGLAFVAISALLKRRVVAFRKGLPPDLLFDVTPSAQRGVEVAARTRGGLGALTAISTGTPATNKKSAHPGKASQLRCRPDVVEAHLSLWCAKPRVAIMTQVKP